MCCKYSLECYLLGGLARQNGTDLLCLGLQPPAQQHEVPSAAEASHHGAGLQAGYFEHQVALEQVVHGFQQRLQSADRERPVAYGPGDADHHGSVQPAPAGR